MRRAFAPAAVLVCLPPAFLPTISPRHSTFRTRRPKWTRWWRAGDGKWLRNKLDLAITLLSRDLRIAAVNQLEESVRTCRERTTWRRSSVTL